MSRILRLADFMSQVTSTTAINNQATRTEASRTTTPDKPAMGMIDHKSLAHLGPDVSLFKALKPFHIRNFYEAVTSAKEVTEARNESPDGTPEIPLDPENEPTFMNSGMLDVLRQEKIPNTTQAQCNHGVRLQPDNEHNRPQGMSQQEEPPKPHQELVYAPQQPFDSADSSDQYLGTTSSLSTGLSDDPADYPYRRGSLPSFPWTNESDILIELVIECVVPKVEGFAELFRKTYYAERHGHGPAARIHAISKETQEVELTFRKVPAPVGFVGSCRLVRTDPHENPIQTDFDYLMDFVVDCIIPEGRAELGEKLRDQYFAVVSGVGLNTKILLFEKYTEKLGLALREVRDDPDLGGPSNLTHIGLQHINEGAELRLLHSIPSPPSSPSPNDEAPAPKHPRGRRFHLSHKLVA